MNHINQRLFSKLPKTSVISTGSGLKKFGENIDDWYNDIEEKQFSEIAKTIYKKLKSEDPEWRWTIKDYSDFKRCFSQVAIKEINTLGPSIQKCLEANKGEIYKELKLISQDFDLYNEMINQEEKTTDKSVRGIKTTDCFYIIKTLLSQMYKEIHSYVSRIINEIDKDETLKDTINRFESDDIIKEQLLKKFESDFDFLTKYDLFKDVYFKIKERSFKEASEMIRKQCGQRKVTEEYRELSNVGPLPKAKVNGKDQLHRDARSGNRSGYYIHKK